MLRSLSFRFQAIYFVYDPLFADSELCAESAFEVTLAFAVMYKETKNSWAKALLKSIWSYTGSYVVTCVLTAWTKNFDEVGRPAADYPDKRVLRKLMFSVLFLPHHQRDSLDVLVPLAEQLERIASNMHLRLNNECHALSDLRFGVLGGRCVTHHYVFPPRSMIMLWRANLDAQDLARCRAAPPSSNHSGSGAGRNHAEGHSNLNAEASHDLVAEGLHGHGTVEPGSHAKQTPGHCQQQTQGRGVAVSPSVEARRKRVSARMVIPLSMHLIQLRKTRQTAAVPENATVSAAVSSVKTDSSR